MLIFEWIIVLLLGAVLLSALARRVGAPYPAFLALGGVVLAFVPGSPTFTLEPDLALALFVAPVLLDAAYDASPRDLKDNWKVLAGLVLVAVTLTTAAVAVVAHALVPALPWAAAVALGAAVSPPDASAATAVLRQVRLPHRMVTILEGESLLNDASALLIYRLAVGAVAAGSLSFADVAPTFALVVIGSIAVGPLLAIAFLRLTEPMQDVPSRIVVQFVVTFGIWILAERLGLSGILTIVSYAITIARCAPARTSARMRVPTYAVWETAVFVLNVLAFVMIGLQLRPIWERLDPAARWEYGLVAAAVLATVILTRFAWVMSYNTVVRLYIARRGFHPPRPMMRPTVRSGLIVSWCGMRGIVTLAAAFGVAAGGPDGRAHFRYRDLIVFTAFCVVLGDAGAAGPDPAADPAARAARRRRPGRPRDRAGAHRRLSGGAADARRRRLARGRSTAPRIFGRPATGGAGSGRQVGAGVSRRRPAAPRDRSRARDDQPSAPEPRDRRRRVPSP